MNLPKVQFFILSFLFLLISCTDNNSTPDNTENSEKKENKDSEKKNKFAKDVRNIGPEKPKAQFAIEEAHNKILEADENNMIGYWVGEFGHNKINIAISEVGEGKASGHSVCAGNYRLINGTEKEIESHIFEYVMNEPGDHKHDGKFEFRINLNEGTLTGKWTPFNDKNNSKKEYVLRKQKFEYKADVGEYPQASQKVLTDTDVENMNAEELRIMRNEIYARHGYSFKNKEIRMHFEKQDWYIPVAVDIREDLKDSEVENIELIYEYESYYEEYYDDFGR
jgi:hypothetical protein